MSESGEMLFEYDEDDAVKFIQNYLPQELKDKYTSDEINYIIDLIYEFYESKGFMDENYEGEVEVDEEEMVTFVAKQAKKNGFAKFTPDDIIFIVQGELEYCESMGMFED